MNINAFLFIVLLFNLQSIDFIFSDEAKLFEVTHSNIHDVKWTSPSNGDFAEVISYEMDVELDQVHKLKLIVAGETLKDHGLSHLQFLKNHDQLEIVREDYFVNHSNQSWFKIKNIGTQILFEAFGPSIKTKKKIPEDVQTVLAQDVRLEKIHEGYCVSFSIENIYVTQIVDSDKFHGFFNGKPYILISQTPFDLDVEGNYRILFSLQDGETNEIVDVNSMILNDNAILLVSSINPVNIRREIRGGGKVVMGFTLQYNIGKFSYKRTHGFGGSSDFNKRYSPESFANFTLTGQGNELIILEEAPDSNNQRFSRFKMSSPKNGEVFDLYGPARKAANP